MGPVGQPAAGRAQTIRVVFSCGFAVSLDDGLKAGHRFLFFTLPWRLASIPDILEEPGQLLDVLISEAAFGQIILKLTRGHGLLPFEPPLLLKGLAHLSIAAHNGIL